MTGPCFFLSLYLIRDSVFTFVCDYDETGNGEVIYQGPQLA